MNFLSGCCLARHCRTTFWNTNIYKEILKTSNILNTDYENQKNQHLYEINSSDIKLCEHLQISRILLNWTQVRYKDHPRLHRDLDFPNFDSYRKENFQDVRKTAWGQGDEKPGYTYVVGFFGLMCTAYSLKTSLVHFISYMAPAADVLAMASIEVDISKVAPGGCSSFKWRGKPLFVKNRTQAEIDLEATTPLGSLRDPAKPEDITVKQEWLVVIGICTHLGCVPIPNSGDFSGGFYCPCHGSHYDNVGRIRKGPAPLNLEVPPHKFLTDTLILVG